MHRRGSPRILICYSPGSKLPEPSQGLSAGRCHPGGSNRHDPSSGGVSITVLWLLITSHQSLLPPVPRRFSTFKRSDVQTFKRQGPSSIVRGPFQPSNLPTFQRSNASTFKRSDVQTFKRLHGPIFQPSILPFFHLAYLLENCWEIFAVFKGVN
jgi:hypothetical protein